MESTLRPTSRLSRFHRALGTAFTLALGVSAAHAVPVTFNYTGAMQTFTVPTTGQYDIVAFGAQGGNGNAAGGFGAKVGSIFSLNAGDVLQIAVGGKGANSTAGGYGGGGGGGSFVYNLTTTSLLEVAGGGGGSYTGAGGQGLSTFGGSGFAGTGGLRLGGGGGGFSASASGAWGGKGFPTLTGGSKSFINGGGGGWGGGGGGGGYGGGGGGGFNGGNSDAPGGLGGTSFSSVTAHTQVSGFQSGNGLVTIEALAQPVPEPATFGMAGLGGLLVLAAAAQRRRRAAARPVPATGQTMRMPLGISSGLSQNENNS